MTGSRRRAANKTRILRHLGEHLTAARRLDVCRRDAFARLLSIIRRKPWEALLEPRMKRPTSQNFVRLRALFAAERAHAIIFADFTDVYCVDAADDVQRSQSILRFARARRGEPGGHIAPLQFLKEDYAARSSWRTSTTSPRLRTTPPAAVLGQDPAVLAEYYRRRCVGLDCKGRLTFYQAYACCVVKKLKTVVSSSRTWSSTTPGSRNEHAMLDAAVTRIDGAA